MTTRKVPVVFDRRVAGSLVASRQRRQWRRGRAQDRFLRDKMGEEVFADGIRIIDDPLRKRGLTSHPFDGEGVAKRTR